MQGDGQEHQARLPYSSMVYHKKLIMKIETHPSLEGPDYFRTLLAPAA